MPWWRNAVVYQIYPRSFQDSNGDGVGDLEGVRSRLDHLVTLGVDGFWLSPIYPSPNADWGYDVSDYTNVHPDFGTLADFDRLVTAAHERGLRVIVDLVPNHTSIEHAWFRERPDLYVWADEPPNNWLAVFGGPAWTRDPQTGRYYRHSFYPEQPDLDWRNADVHEAIADVMRFWLARGADGFRVDAIDQISKDPEQRDDPPAKRPPPLPLLDSYARLEHLHSRNWPGVERLLDPLRRAAGDALLVGEVYQPTSELRPYLTAFDRVFAFEFLFSEWSAERLAAIIAPAAELGHIAWVLSNHDFARIATRAGVENARLAAALLLTLPGTAFLYQGDEIGLQEGPGAEPPFDRAGRDRVRHPMQWGPEPKAGFTTGDAWLPPVDPERTSVAVQRDDAGSLLTLHRRLIELRRTFEPGFELLGVEDEVLSYRRGKHLVRLNFSDEERPGADDVVLTTEAGAGRALPPRSGVVSVA
jgi:alpha-glucosidase